MEMLLNGSWTDCSSAWMHEVRNTQPPGLRFRAVLAEYGVQRMEVTRA